MTKIYVSAVAGTDFRRLCLVKLSFFNCQPIRCAGTSAVAVPFFQWWRLPQSRGLRKLLSKHWNSPVGSEAMLCFSLGDLDVHRFIDPAAFALIKKAGCLHKPLWVFYVYTTPVFSNIAGWKIPTMNVRRCISYWKSGPFPASYVSFYWRVS